MPSLQARLYSLIARAYLKRRPIEDEAAFVNFARRRFTPPRWLRQPLPASAVVKPVNTDGVRGEWVTAQNVPARHTIYYLHGGGYIFGTLETYRPLNAALAKEAQAQVFALNYRLAPEHRFPAAVEDAVAGYRWLLAQGARPENLLIAGDSAGGGLALSTLLKLRAEQLPLPAAAVCFSPWTDLAVTGASISINEACDPLFYGASIKRLAPIYLGKAAPNDPLASPLCGDLTGLPPLLIFVSDTEVLLDDATRLAQKAKAAGVTVDLQIWHGLLHVWPIFIRHLPEARATIPLIVQFLRTHLAG
jgi:epsilon-lactone hydrolase